MGGIGGMDFNTKLLGAVSIICYGLGMFWLQNMWAAIENERKAREVLLTSISQTYATKDTIGIIAAARERQLSDLTQRLDRIERKLDEIREAPADQHGIVPRVQQ
jgi:hypothetical protein